LLATGEALCAQPVDLVAIDMPVAHSPIVGRRFCDDAVSKAYASRKCATYPPSALRPGAMSDALTQDFARAGHPLLTQAITPPGLIEVYPHPALVELTGAAERLPYKMSKLATYWPSLTQRERRTRLHRQWREIIASLEAEIDGVAEVLPKLDLDAGASDLKAYEDMLDAVVCAWVGVCALEGRAMPYGNQNAAIWVPRPRAGTPPRSPEADNGLIQINAAVRP
jgi:predicted RNase H-like nuclease